MHTKCMIIPYKADKEAFTRLLDEDCPDLVLCHQGIVGSDQGHYIQDHSAISKEDVKDRVFISGHYHKRQTLKCPGKGLYHYVGNPYTIDFGESDDPEKGFQILYSDFTLKVVKTNVRKHVKYETVVSDMTKYPYKGPQIFKDDLVWFKIHGTPAELATCNKAFVKTWAKMHEDQPLKLDLVPEKCIIIKPELTAQPIEALDQLIDESSATLDQKERLKKMWRIQAG